MAKNIAANGLELHRLIKANVGVNEIEDETARIINANDDDEVNGDSRNCGQNSPRELLSGCGWFSSFISFST